MQFLDTHKKKVHNNIKEFKCRVCHNKFSKQGLLNLHVKRNHSSNMYNCSECGKKSKLYINHLKHVETHSKSRKKCLSSLKKSQLHVRCKEEIQSIRKALFDAPENHQKSMWNQLIKDCPYYMDKVKENPLTEAEVIELIKDNNLSDRQVLNICKFLRQKWGKEVITPNISKKLIKRKTILHQFFTETRLDKTTQLHFQTKNKAILSRSVTYCHDLPGLIAFKKLVENLDDDNEVMNVVGINDGKDILKIVWNWSLMFKTEKGKRKLMGPKRSIILVAVSKVKESYFNMAVFLDLT